MEITIRVLDRGGDTPHVFDVANETAMAEAEALFKRLQGEGYNAYRDEGGGKAGGLRDNFTAESVVMAPNLYLG